MNSLDSLVQQLTRADEELASTEFDPAALLGDLRDKVDGIRMVHERMESVAQWLKDQAKPLTDKARTLEKNRQRLREYVATTMAANHFHRLPGNTWRIDLRDGPPSVQTDYEPSSADYLRWPKYVKIETKFVWDKETLRTDLTTGRVIPAEVIDGDASEHPLPARLHVGQWPDFKPNVPEQLERKKKK